MDETGQSYRATIARFLAVGFVALLGVIVSTGVLMTMNQRQTAWIMHTYQVQREISQIRLTVTQLIGVKAGNRLRASVHGTERAAGLKATLDTSIDRLAQMTGDNPRQQARIPLLKANASQIEGQAGLDVPLDARIGTLSDDPGEVVTVLCVAMQDEETRLLDLRNARRADITTAFYAILGLTAVLLAAVALLGFTTIDSYTREIQRSRQALAKANSGLEAAVQERTGELIRANAEIQRFAYIVSHDLRAPLVNIMGFTAEIDTATRSLQAELDKALVERPHDVAPIVRTAITEDMPEAIDFIRTSARKMDRLINAILHLSRLGRRQLNPEWLNLPALVQTVVDTVQQQITDAGATAEIAQGMPQVFADSVALEQILANLIENAIKYRHPSRPLHLRVSAERHGDRITIAVADNGRGIDPRDSERVFDLFRRAGAQDQPGEGIGLAHVRALAYRLGGTISLESAAGVGSTFTLTLPVHFDEDQGLPA